MTNSVYIIGGAGSGKSTFTAALLERMGGQLGPLEALHSLPNKKATVTLRGQRLGDGLYLGLMRDKFPGTDGLDRASSPVGADWLANAELPSFIIGEGATLTTRPFLEALHAHTDLLLVHLFADDMIVDLRFLQRGSQQAWSWVTNTVTRARNMHDHIQKLGAWTMEVDTADPEQWDAGLGICWNHLQNG